MKKRWIVELSSGNSYFVMLDDKTPLAFRNSLNWLQGADNGNGNDIFIDPSAIVCIREKM